MSRSRSWRRQQYRKTSQKRSNTLPIQADVVNTPRKPRLYKKHTPHPADCGVATCSICHPEKFNGNSTKITTPKSIRKRELVHELKLLNSLPIEAIRDVF